MVDKRDTGDMYKRHLYSNIEVSTHLEFQSLLQISSIDLEKRRKSQLQSSGWWLMIRRIDGIRLRFAGPPEYLEKLKVRNDRKHPIELRMFDNRQLHRLRAGKDLRRSSGQKRQLKIESRCACGLP